MMMITLDGSSSLQEDNAATHNTQKVSEWFDEYVNDDESYTAAFLAARCPTHWTLRVRLYTCG